MIKRLLGDNILVKPRYEDLTNSVIIVPQIAQKRRPDLATIVLIGEKCKEPALAVGQLVVIEDFVGTGTPYDVDGVPHLIIDSEEILAILEPPEDVKLEAGIVVKVGELAQRAQAKFLSETVKAPTEPSKTIHSVNKPRGFA